jgi:hypothetical protein
MLGSQEREMARGDGGQRGRASGCLELADERRVVFDRRLHRDRLNRPSPSRRSEHAEPEVVKDCARKLGIEAAD